MVHHRFLFSFALLLLLSINYQKLFGKLVVSFCLINNLYYCNVKYKPIFFQLIKKVVSMFNVTEFKDEIKEIIK